MRKKSLARGRKVRMRSATARSAPRAPAATGDKWLDDFIPYRLYRVTHKLNARLMNRLRAQRINPSRWRVLSVLKAHGHLSINGIVDAALMEQPTASRVVAKLEREGRVARRPADRDSRVMEISLTPAGMAAFNEIAPAALNHQEIAFRNVSRKEIGALLAVLEKIEQNIRLNE
jgi:MarR family transcriptional regulator, organic hydroperoxide resistance regulator